MTAPRRPEEPGEIREQVREGYTHIAQTERPGRDQRSREAGYQDAQLDSVPDDAVDGLGCGNPTAIDQLRLGEVVLDLGCGAGMDSFLAARAVGNEGRVIGVDMTDAMLERARENARKGGFTNVEFRKGFIEDLPIDDESVDVILSNCVINLSPQKDRVYGEAHRVLRPGGRLMVSDIVLEQPLPKAVLDSVDAWLGCVAGAIVRSEYLATIEKAGFRDVRITKETSVEGILSLDDPAAQDAMQKLDVTREQAEGYMRSVTSLHIFAVK
jgi:SAM-dependent methyltransferase